MNRKPLKLLGVLLALGLLAAACGDDKTDETAPAGSTQTSAGHSSTSGGAASSDLRAGLTALLQEHVYLAGTTTGIALSGEDFKPAAGALEKNTQGLQDAVASVYGDAGGQQFGDLWRKHIAFFVDYTTGKATSDQAMINKARADLDGYRADFGAFMESATKGGLPKQAVSDDLKVHVDSLFAAIDAQAAGDPDSVEKLRVAASHMPNTANVLATAITAQFPQKFSS